MWDLNINGHCKCVLVLSRQPPSLTTSPVFSHHLTTWARDVDTLSHLSAHASTTSMLLLLLCLYYFYACGCKASWRSKTKNFRNFIPTRFFSKLTKKRNDDLSFHPTRRLTFVLLLYSLYASRAGYTHYNEKRKIVQESKNYGHPLSPGWACSEAKP